MSGIAAGRFGTFVPTEDGASWFRSMLHVPVDAPAPHTLNAIWMFPSQVGFVVGANGVLIRTTTGGQVRYWRFRSKRSVTRQ